MIGRFLVLCLAASCFVSFAWGLRHHFQIPDDGVPAAMRWLSALGTAFAFWHLAAIIYFEPPAPLLRVAGGALYIVAGAIFWSAIRVSRHRPPQIAFSDQIPDSLMTHGPYAWIRHPFYASYTCAWIAGVLVTMRPELLGSVAVMVAFYIWAIVHEEKSLATGPLACAHADYRRKVGALFPRLKVRD